MEKILYKKLLIFDADGTLIDSENDVFSSFNYILKRNLNIEITKKQFEEMAGLPLEHIFKSVLPEDKKNLNLEFTKQFRKYYIDEKHFLDTTILFLGVKETIQELKKQGFIMTIASSKPKRALDYMVNFFDFKEFDMVIGTGESTFKHKPNPEVIEYILNELEIKREDAVIIGDSQADILAAKNANIDSISLTYGYDTRENLLKCEPKYIIDDFRDIINIVKFK